MSSGTAAMSKCDFAIACSEYLRALSVLSDVVASDSNEATRLLNSRVSVLSNMAVAYRSSGNYEQSRSVLEKAWTMIYDASAFSQSSNSIPMRKVYSSGQAEEAANEISESLASIGLLDSTEAKIMARGRSASSQNLQNPESGFVAVPRNSSSVTRRPYLNIWPDESPADANDDEMTTRMKSVVKDVISWLASLKAGSERTAVPLAERTKSLQKSKLSVSSRRTPTEKSSKKSFDSTGAGKISGSGVLRNLGRRSSLSSLKSIASVSSGHRLKVAAVRPVPSLVLLVSVLNLLTSTANFHTTNKNHTTALECHMRCIILAHAVFQAIPLPESTAYAPELSKRDLPWVHSQCLKAHARSTSNLAATFSALGDAHRGVRFAQAAESLVNGLVATNSRQHPWPELHAATLANLGVSQFCVGRLADAASAFSKSARAQPNANAADSILTAANFGVCFVEAARVGRCMEFALLRSMELGQAKQTSISALSVLYAETQLYQVPGKLWENVESKLQKQLQVFDNFPEGRGPWSLDLFEGIKRLESAYRQAFALGIHEIASTMVLNLGNIYALSEKAIYFISASACVISNQPHTAMQLLFDGDYSWAVDLSDEINGKPESVPPSHLHWNIPPSAILYNFAELVHSARSNTQLVSNTTRSSNMELAMEILRSAIQQAKEHSLFEDEYGNNSPMSGNFLVTSLMLVLFAFGIDTKSLTVIFCVIVSTIIHRKVDPEEIIAHNLFHEFYTPPTTTVFPSNYPRLRRPYSETITPRICLAISRAIAPIYLEEDFVTEEDKAALMEAQTWCDVEAVHALERVAAQSIESLPTALVGVSAAQLAKHQSRKMPVIRSGIIKGRWVAGAMLSTFSACGEGYANAAVEIGSTAIELRDSAWGNAAACGRAVGLAACRIERAVVRHARRVLRDAIANGSARLALTKQMRLQSLVLASCGTAVATAATVSAFPAAAIVRYASGSVRAQSSAIGRTADSHMGVSGLLVPIRGFACTEETIIADVLPGSAISNALISGSPSPPFIALVERGQCAFVDKIRLLQAAGFAAIVVGDNVDPADRRLRQRLVTMVSTEDEAATGIVIPSYFVSSVGYNALVAAIDSPNEPVHTSLFKISALPSHIWGFLASVVNSASSSAISSDAPLKFEGLLLVNIEPSTFYDKVFLIFLLLTAPLILSFLLQLLQWLTVLKTLIEDIAASRLVLSLPTRIWNGSRSIQSDVVCAICLEEYSSGETLRILPCRHEFHVDCVDRWLSTAIHTCPLCKQAINRHYKNFQPNLSLSLQTPSPRRRSDTAQSRVSSSPAGNTAAIVMSDAVVADRLEVLVMTESSERAKLFGIFLPRNSSTAAAPVAQTAAGSSSDVPGEQRQCFGVNARTPKLGGNPDLLDAVLNEQEDEEDAVVPHVS
ncbi:hypothetical protein HDU82_005130 [Entophlyctis luteolus]|nr:hypothetical protein HDU82_005130 [Entophlyctis luteolus]